MSATAKATGVMTSVQLLAPASRSAGAISGGTGVDIQLWEGVIMFEFSAGALGGGTLSALAIEHADASGGSFAAVDMQGQTFSTSANTTSSVTIDKSKLKRWVRFAGTITGGTGTLCGATVVGVKKYS